MTPNSGGRHLARLLLPIAALALSLLAWDLIVRLNGLPPYVLPGPGLVLATLVTGLGRSCGSRS